MTSESQSACRRILEEALQRKVTHIAHHRSEYESSFELQNLDVALEDGTVLPMVFKDVGPNSILPAARDSKQELFFDPCREIQMYRSILSPTTQGTAICHACEINKTENRYWLFLERINGLKLSFVGDFEIWLEAVRWLAGFHETLSSQVDVVQQKAATIQYDSAYYQRWCDRAVDFIARTAPTHSSVMRQVATKYHDVIDRLNSMPITVCHGDCYPSNLLVRDVEAEHPICAVDWELTAVGPGLIDLASLTAGKWDATERSRFVSAYFHCRPGTWQSENSLNDDLNWCRLQLAVQWLGWSPKWAPPIDQANDWLDEMITLAGVLNLL